MDNIEAKQKYQTQRQKLSRNLDIVREWEHRYREGKKPITLSELAIAHGLSKNRIFAIIKRYGKNTNTGDSPAE